ncbi:hypothetical protein N657DRAFT_221525 [Parathielavia appendiculata]|uniref:Uncharacterized protein n=1 Tax=Parathielavia appendiculata TaxID=2587402 RepID=A0AAN6U774_9PEZI|nr:hypothetical protein N657DRAFT_221525 [Parathielavia appendiculata]
MGTAGISWIIRRDLWHLLSSEMVHSFHCLLRCCACHRLCYAEGMMSSIQIPCSNRSSELLLVAGDPVYGLDSDCISRDGSLATFTRPATTPTTTATPTIIVK